MHHGFHLTIAIFYTIVCKILTVNFDGKTPPNSYIIPVVPGDVVNAYANWNSSATDLDLHIYQPGRVITDSTSDLCQCFCCTSS